MPSRTTLTAWGHGALKSLKIIVIIVIFFVVMLISKLASGILSKDPNQIAYEIVLDFVFLAFMTTWFHERTSRGKILFDCSPHPAKYLFLLIAVFCLIIIMMDFFHVILAPKLFGLYGSEYIIPVTAFFFILATGRLQVTEKGIWRYWSILRWGKIRSYRWADDSTLVFREKGSFSLFKGALHVPQEHRQAVDEFLRTHASVQPTA